MLHKNVMAINHVIIHRPIEEVARFAADPNSAPDWYRNIHEVNWLSTGGLELGSKIAFRARFLGRTLSYTYEIQEYIPGHRLTMSTTQGPFPMTTQYVWTATKSGHTKMTLKNSGQPTGFGWYLMPILRWSVNRANRKDLALLKSILETTP